MLPHLVQGPRRPYEPPHGEDLLSGSPALRQGAGHPALVCAWCGTLVMEGRGPASHGICGACMDARHPVRVALQALGVVAFFPALLIVLCVVTP